MNRYLITAMLLAATVAPAAAQKSEPLTIGETFIIESKALGEARRINVYAPAAFTDTAKSAWTVSGLSSSERKERYECSSSRRRKPRHRHHAE